MGILGLAMETPELVCVAGTSKSRGWAMSEDQHEREKNVFTLEDVEC